MTEKKEPNIWVGIVIGGMVAAIVMAALFHKPPCEGAACDPDEPEPSPTQKACAAGFAINVTIDRTKPDGSSWDLLPGDEPPDPSGKLTLFDGEEQTEVFRKRKDQFKISGVPFFNGKNKRRVHRSATFDLHLVDVDAVNFSWTGGGVSTNDYIAHFKGVSLEDLLEGESVTNGSATLTGAHCLSE